MKKVGFLTIALATAALVISVPAQAAIITFATMTPLTADNLYFKNAAADGKSASASMFSIATPTATTAGSALVGFSFINLNSQLTGAVSNVQALFTFNGNVVNTPATPFFGFLIQPGISGSFSLVTTSAITVGSTTYASGSNLLSAAFTGGSFFGPSDANSGSVGGRNANGGTLNYSSAFLNFAPGAGLDTSFNLSAITPKTSVATGGNYALQSFRSDASGSFSADPSPSITATVPEPATWVMMLAGFGMIGFSLRSRRRQHVRVAYA